MRRSALAACCLIVTACSSQDTKLDANLQEHFNTEITVNGSKMFTYQLSARGPQAARQGPRVKREKNTERPAKGGLSKKKLKSRLHTLLDHKLTTSGYCREGYLELDSFVSRTSANLRGECRETATSEDRLNFPNQA